MARPLRVKYEGACYHVINRGNRREVVFNDGGDCELFLEKLAEFAELYEVDIHSYCLMPNHFHLQIRTRLANLDKFMQSFLTSFTIKMNRSHSKSGHLFQGRYKAQLVESSLYKNRLSRYIHLNPVKIQGCEGLPLSTLKSRLLDYKWSSYRCYIGLDPKPKWLDRRFILSQWGSDAAEKMDNYRKYVEQGMKSDNGDDVQALLGGVVLGSEEFKEKIVDQYLRHDIKDIDSREQPLLAKVNAFRLESVLEALCEYYGVGGFDEILERRGCHHKARKTAMFLAGKYCRGNETLTSLAARFGLKISGFNMAGDRVKREMAESSTLRKSVADIERVIKNKSNKVEV